MINDIMKERTPDQKPRFFLHDEVKAWLGDNLKVSIRVAPNYSSNYDVHNKLQEYGFYNPIMVGFAMETTVTIDDELVYMQGSNTLMMETETLTKIMLHKFDAMEARIKHLEATNDHLRRRIELLENPLPV